MPNLTKKKLHLIDLKTGEQTILKLKREEICEEGFRRDINGHLVRGVPHRNPNDCWRFCARDTCERI